MLYAQARCTEAAARACAAAATEAAAAAEARRLQDALAARDADAAAAASRLQDALAAREADRQVRSTCHAKLVKLPWPVNSQVICFIVARDGLKQDSDEAGSTDGRETWPVVLQTL